MSVHISRISYVDKDWIPIVFTSLVINVKGLNPATELKTFFLKHDYPWVTNGKLLILSEMSSKPNFLTRILKEIDPIPDCAYIHEQLLHGVGGRLNPLLGKELPETENLPWITSKLTENGTFVKAL